MNRQEIRNRAKRKRAREVAKKKLLLLMIATILFVVIGGIAIGNSFSSVQVNAEESCEQYKYYKSIAIESGDTLWSIAKEYCTDYSVEMQDYIDEVKELNNLASNEIHQGQHLMIVYYDTQYK